MDTAPDGRGVRSLKFLTLLLLRLNILRHILKFWTPTQNSKVNYLNIFGSV